MRDSAGPSRTVRAKPSSTGFVTLPVSTLQAAMDAWGLTYNWLRRKELIPPSRHRIHTYPQAASENALVVTGWIGPLPVSTLTAIRDSDDGLPLDRSFGDLLAPLRHSSRKIIEVSLFGDRRKEMARTTESLLWLMRLAWTWGQLQDVDDFLIAVSPEHRKHYQTGFGFEPIGEAKPYANIGGKVAQLMRCDVNAWTHHKSPPGAVRFLIQNPADPDTFENRYLFPKPEVNPSPVGDYLRELASNRLWESA